MEKELPAAHYKKTPEKWRLYNGSLCLAQNDYEGAAALLEPLTDRYDRKAPFREDPDALFQDGSNITM